MRKVLALGRDDSCLAHGGWETRSELAIINLILEADGQGVQNRVRASQSTVK
jgi:hypothetical protein